MYILARDLEIDSYFRRERGEYVYKCLTNNNCDGITGIAFTKCINLFKRNDKLILCEKSDYDLQVKYQKVIKRKKEKTTPKTNTDIKYSLNKISEDWTTLDSEKAYNFVVFNRKKQQPTQKDTFIVKGDEMRKRLVKIVIFDHDDRLKGKYEEKALVYSGEEFTTGLSDAQIVMKFNVGEYLDIHNKVRETILDLEATRTLGHEVFLEAIDVDDLDVRVVQIA